ncbi:hypothetical protein Q3G72_014522 [Acer saccharum]|nr:hypothetical protein Q3G72_014522 [Acer saccharum]
MFLINYFTCKRENENLALAWAAKFATKDSIFEKNFSLPSEKGRLAVASERMSKKCSSSTPRRGHRYMVKRYDATQNYRKSQGSF